MSISVNVNEVLTLLGHKTLMLAKLEGECEIMAQRYNELVEENASLKKRISELEVARAEIAEGL